MSTLPDPHRSTAQLRLPSTYIEVTEELGRMQGPNGAVRPEHRKEAAFLVPELARRSRETAVMFGQLDYAEALHRDFMSWLAAGVETVPDFSSSRDALQSPATGMPFFFTGPLRLANGGRKGWRMECFLSIREEPSSDEYRKIYETFPHPKNICQSSHLLSGSQGLTYGNNIVFFPENILAGDPIGSQAYAVFFFNKFHRIFNEITLPAFSRASSAIPPRNRTANDPRGTYLARCVWGYLHDYFHHQGRRPFDEHVAIKTRWFTGLLEEIKVDLETWLACVEGGFVDADIVAEFILLDRAFRYPCEPDWFRNFDSGTGLLVLSMLERSGVVNINDSGRIEMDMGRLPGAARRFIEEVRTIEALADEEYLAAAKEMVRSYLPAGPEGERIGLPGSLSNSEMALLVGLSWEPLIFDDRHLRASLREAKQDA